jgi:pilus assembly protein CpaF
MVEELLDEVTGLGPLEPLLRDNSISDILVNTYSTVYIERFGKIELTGVRFRDNAHLTQIINRIVSRVGRRVDETSPMVDARLQDGSRVNAIIPRWPSTGRPSRSGASAARPCASRTSCASAA